MKLLRSAKEGQRRSPQLPMATVTAGLQPVSSTWNCRASSAGEADGSGEAQYLNVIWNRVWLRGVRFYEAGQSADQMRLQLVPWRASWCSRDSAKGRGHRGWPEMAKREHRGRASRVLAAAGRPLGCSCPSAANTVRPRLTRVGSASLESP